MIKAVLFDLDGTLINSLDDLADSANYVLNRSGYPTHGTEKYKYFVGNGIPKLIERILPEDKRTNDIKLKLLNDFLNRYRLHCMDKTRPYEGMTELIKRLKNDGYHLAVVTNKAHEMAVKITEKFFYGSFSVICGKQDGFPAKPDPQLTLKIIEDLGLAPKDCAFVGDSGVDVLTAKNAGCISIGALWGFRTRQELIDSGADFLAETPLEIFDILKNLNLQI
ncbi:MAG: HAD family hydrolase [Acutalibacteraceae bacterium]|jgi:phosphoglycolate phosphatase